MPHLRMPLSNSSRGQDVADAIDTHPRQTVPASPRSHLWVKKWGIGWGRGFRGQVRLRLPSLTSHLSDMAVLGHIDGHQLSGGTYVFSHAFTPRLRGNLLTTAHTEKVRVCYKNGMAWIALATLRSESACCARPNGFCNQRKVVWSMEVRTNILIPPEVQRTDA